MRLRQQIAFLVVISLLSSSVHAQNESRNALTIRLLQWAVGIFQIGLYKVFVHPGDIDIAKHTRDIAQICGVDALVSTFDRGYIVETSQACILRLAAKSWVL